MSPLDENGLSAEARTVLDGDLLARIVEAWGRGRALILNANKPGYSERFTIEREQYALVRTAIYEAIRTYQNERGEVLLKDIVASVQTTLETHARFPNGRLTNFTRYTKTDLEARGELERIPKSSPQRVRLARAMHDLVRSDRM